MVRQHHRLNGYNFEQTPGDSEGQGSLAHCNPWGCKESNTAQQLNNKNNKRGPRKLPPSFHHLRSQQKKKVHEPGSGPSPDTEPSGISIMKFPASRTVKNKVLLFTNDPGYVISLQQSKGIKIHLSICDNQKWLQTLPNLPWR